MKSAKTIIPNPKTAQVTAKVPGNPNPGSYSKYPSEKRTVVLDSAPMMSSLEDEVMYQLLIARSICETVGNSLVRQNPNMKYARTLATSLEAAELAIQKSQRLIAGLSGYAEVGDIRVDLFVRIPESKKAE